MKGAEKLETATTRALAGNFEKDAGKLASQNKRFVRERIGRLLVEGSFVEVALLAYASAEALPADGVITGTGLIDGRPVCVMANDPTVKAGSWGARTVEKILRLTEYALKHEVPVVYLVDSAGARITDQVELFRARITAIASPTDAVVGHAATFDHHSPDVRHVDIDASHLGLCFNPTVWRLIADTLNRPGPATAP